MVEDRGLEHPLSKDGLVIRTADHLHLRVVSKKIDIDVADLNCDAHDDKAVETTRADATLIAVAPELLVFVRGLHEDPPACVVRPEISAPRAVCGCWTCTLLEFAADLVTKAGG